MNRIRINRGSFNIGQHELEQGVITIGRNPSNDIHLNDTIVSGRHAKITTMMNTSYIQDLDSTNGTFVNDQKVTQRLLRNNDVITVGNIEIMFFSDQPVQQAAPNAAADVEKTQIAYNSKPAAQPRKVANPYVDSDNPFLNGSRNPFLKNTK